MGLSTIGSIATHIIESFNNVSDGISGNMIEIVDMARQHVANFTKKDIGSNSIAETYQPAILSFAKADTIDLVNAQAGGGADLKIAELSISDSGDVMSATQYRMLAESQLKSIGRGISFARSLS